MKGFGIPGETGEPDKNLEGTRSNVRVEGELSEKCYIERGLRQGDVLSTIRVNSQKSGKANKYKPRGTIFNRMMQCLAYADDTVLISRSQQHLKEGFMSIVDVTTN